MIGSEEGEVCFHDIHNTDVRNGAGICLTRALVVLLPVSPLASRAAWARGSHRGDGAGERVAALAAEARGGCGGRGEATTHQSWNETQYSSC